MDRPVSGRTFVSNSTAGANAVYAYTDNDGDSYIPFGVARAQRRRGPSDDRLRALSGGLERPGHRLRANHGEAVYYCSQDIVGPASCYRSDTLGTSYGASTLAYTGNGLGTGRAAVPGGPCGGLHGHLHVAPDGTAWLPVNQCGGLQGGVFSTDGGTTWVNFTVPNGYLQANGADPSIAIDADSTIYYGYVNNEPVATGNPAEGHAHARVGTALRQPTITWTSDVDLGTTHGIVNAAEIQSAGGSSGRAAIGFLGTDVPGDYQNITFPGKWYVFIATTYDHGARPGPP